MFAQVWKSSLVTAILHWWTPRVKSMTAVVDQNAKTALAIVIAIRQRDSLVAARKVSKKKKLSHRYIYVTSNMSK